MKSLRISLVVPLLAAIAGICIISCNDERIDPSPVDFSYFPLEVGSYIIYELDSVVYDDFNDIVTTRSLLVREIIESVFVDASRDTSFRVERQYRENEMSVWGSAGYDIWFAAIEGNNAERIEENQRYIVLSFPLRVGKTWNGTQHINVDPDGELGYLDDWEYRITSLDVPMMINGISFDSTVTVIEQAVGTAIDTIGSRAVYARNVGLVFKELYVLETQCTDCDPGDVACVIACQQMPWEDKAEKGFIIRQRILEYGTL